MTVQDRRCPYAFRCLCWHPSTLLTHERRDFEALDIEAALRKRNPPIPWVYALRPVGGKSSALEDLMAWGEHHVKEDSFRETEEDSEELDRKEKEETKK